MHTGIIIRFDAVNGTGFILADDTDVGKVYLTEAALEDSVPNLWPGQRVSFEVEYYQTYRAAKHVHVLPCKISRLVSSIKPPPHVNLFRKLLSMADNVGLFGLAVRFLPVGTAYAI